MHCSKNCLQTQLQRLAEIQRLLLSFTRKSQMIYINCACIFCSTIPKGFCCLTQVDLTFFFSIFLIFCKLLSLCHLLPQLLEASTSLQHQVPVLGRKKGKAKCHLNQLSPFEGAFPEVLPKMFTYISLAKTVRWPPFYAKKAGMCKFSAGYIATHPP